MESDRKRRENERKFGQWKTSPDGGRTYWLDVPGLHGWTARYVKKVDASEQTVLFLQEIFDGNSQLVEIHEKFPVDRGHVRMERG